MGIRLVESVRLSCNGENPRWGMGAASAAVLFDGEFFAVSCGLADCQPDGPELGLEWSDIFPDTDLPAEIAGWYGPGGIELVEAADLACDGYIAEPVAS